MKFVGHRVVEAEVALFVGGKPVVGHAHLRELGNVKRQRLGLFTGAGVGFALGILFVAQWFLTVVYIIVCGCVGCLCGYFAASIVYRKQS